MIVHVRLQMEGISVDESFNGRTAEDVVLQMKASAAKRVGFVVKLALSGMTPLAFAREAVVRYNQQSGKSIPPPASCEDFIDSGVAEGFFRLAS